MELSDYETQLKQVELAISATTNVDDLENLKTLQNDLKQLIELTNNEDDNEAVSNAEMDSMDDEYARFMSAIASSTTSDDEEEKLVNELKMMEGMKCRAPHQHTWGDSVYHNAIICTVLNTEAYHALEVKILYTNPTHREMLPCPYYLEGDCKFTEAKCRYSHGEVVRFEQLEEYTQPDYAKLQAGSLILAKQSDNLWHRAKIKRVFNQKCLVTLDKAPSKDVEIDFVDVCPLNYDGDEEDEEEEDLQLNYNEEDVINMSLLIKPSDEKLGSWEQFTKGIGSKLMQKMGYIIGTGLGKDASGRIDPVTAVILPQGKSLDHCMELREKAGGDKDLFNVERKLKRLRRKQEAKNEKLYERAKQNKVDLFNFINTTLAGNSSTSSNGENSGREGKTQHRTDIRKETGRNLNVEMLKIEERIRDMERERGKVRMSLERHNDTQSLIHKQLRGKVAAIDRELEVLHGKAENIRNEQSLRSDKRKLTVF